MDPEPIYIFGSGPELREAHLAFLMSLSRHVLEGSALLLHSPLGRRLVIMSD